MGAVASYGYAELEETVNGRRRRLTLELGLDGYSSVIWARLAVVDGLELVRGEWQRLTELELDVDAGTLAGLRP